MSVMKTVLACCVFCTIASTAAHAQASGSSMKPDSMQQQKMSKMGDTTGKHAMAKKGDAMAKKDDKKGMMKPKAANDSGMMKHDGMGVDSSKAMKKPKG